MTYAPVHQIRTHMMREAGSRFGWTDLRIWTRQQRSPIYRYSNIIKRSFGLWLAGLSRATFSPMQSRGEPTEDDSGTDSYPVATCLFSKRNMEEQFVACKGAWEGGRKSSLDAPRTHYILPINHSAYREATGYESDSGTFPARLTSWFKIWLVTELSAPSALE